MSAISQLLLARFWPSFKGRFMGPFWTVPSCHADICQGNICPYQEYLSCYWPDFDQTLKEGSWDHLRQIPTVKVTFVQATYVMATFVHTSNISTQGQCKVNVRSMQGQGKVRAREGKGKFKVTSRQGKTKVKVRSRQGQGRVKARSKQGQREVKARSS